MKQKKMSLAQLAEHEFKTCVNNLVNECNDDIFTDWDECIALGQAEESLVYLGMIFKYSHMMPNSKFARISKILASMQPNKNLDATNYCQAKEVYSILNSKFK